MVMVILGVSGCMAMIITGFGLRDSISDIPHLQFSEIYHYDAQVTYTKNQKDKPVAKLIKDDANRSLLISNLAIETEEIKGTTQSVNVMVPEQTSELSKFVTLRNRKTKAVQKLTGDGAIINEKLAKFLDVKIGDKFTVIDNQKKKRTIKVSGVAENYVGHFIYMTADNFKKTFDETPNYSARLIQWKDNKKSAEDKVTSDLMNESNIINVTNTSSIGDQLKDSLKSLNVVMWVMILSAGLLAFIVLYNLTNINISERIRELSTIKVLGFYDKEVTIYIYRENILLTLMGIFVGVFLGKILHSFVLTTAELSNVMFSPTIHPISFVYSGVLTLFFSLVVMLIMHVKLKHIDMIDALKSSE
jgi:putative ABC transport system permease protein